MTGSDTELAAGYLRKAEVIAIPTETVYGLAANALNEHAVLSVFRIKNRPFFDPLIIHVDSLESAGRYVKSIPEKAVRLAERFWPGPLTLLLPKLDIIPDLVTSGSELVAIRVPAHPLTLELLGKLDFPLAAPSANPFGYISPTRADHVEKQLGHLIPYILDGGECRIGLESTIVDCSTDQTKVLRLGGLSLKEIEDCTGEHLNIQLSAGSNPSAPGQLDRHYAPGTKFILSKDPESEFLKHKGYKTAFLNFGEFRSPEGIYTLNLSHTGDTDEAAMNLFHYMRLLDSLDFDVIIALKLPETGLGAAINDRLKRASFK
jgi:L-threonylcarbamoyladenylate synthase